MANNIRGITVEIDGSTTKLTTALLGVNKEIKSTQTELKEVEKLLKLDPGNTELLAQRERALGEAVSSTKQKLETLKTAAEQANAALAAGTINQSQYDALQREIIETEQDLKRLEQQAKTSSVAMGQIVGAGEKLKGTGENITNLGQKFMPVTAAVGGLATASVATAADFEQAMSQVQATMGITKDSMSTVNGESVNTMDALSKLAKQMGAETAFSATQCSQALNYLALAGYDTQQMCDTLPTVLNLAAAGDIELARASDMVTDVMSALGLSASDASKMVDQMAKTASSTNTSVAQLGEGMLTVGATAKTLKGGTEELSTALGILANNGIKGAEGGTLIRNVIMSLQTPMDKAKKQMDDLGVSVFDSEGNMRSLNDILSDLNKSMDGMTMEQKQNIIGTIFNKTDLAGVNALLANTGKTWDDLQNKIANSNGAAKQMADTQLDNLKGQITILKSAIEGLAISIGEILIPYIKNIVSGIQSFVDGLNSLSPAVKTVVVTIGLIAAAIGPVLIIIGQIATGVGAVLTLVPKIVAGAKAVAVGIQAAWAILSANPIGLVVTAIAALVAAFIYLWNTNEDFRQFWIDLWETIKSTVTTVVNVISQFLTDAWTAINAATTGAWTAISAFFTTIWTGIQTVFTTAVTAISTFLTTAWTTIQTGATTVWTAISTYFTTVLTEIQTTFTNIWNAIQSAITTVTDTIKSNISSAWDAIKNKVTTILTAIQEAASSAFNNMLSSITGLVENIRSAIVSGFDRAKSYITGLASQAYSWGRDIINGIVNGIRSSMSSISSACSSVASSIRSYLHFSVPDKGPLTDYESWMPDFMEGLASGIEKSKVLVAKAMDSVAATMDLSSSVPGLEATLNANLNGKSEADSNEVTLNQPIMLDGKVITTLVSQIQYSQGQAKLRNLGTV